ncbi:MAG: iron ABC transporter permease [Pseudobutyrivibrio sp.]|nr:iron ABC transporter permease [Pseudobutyrivibrio sp.]
MNIRKRNQIYVLKIALLFAMVIGLCFLTLSYGETNNLIMQFRIPRTTAALLCGIAFGMAGNVFQSLLNNPLASPDIIGVSSGSTAAAVYCILFMNLNRNLVSIIATLAGIFIAALIYRISYLNKFSSNRLILVGIGFQAFFSALINWMIMKAAEYDVPTAMRWMNGNLNGIVTDSLPFLGLVVFICFITIIALNHGMQSLLIGEQTAIIHGVNVNLTRTLLIICSVILIAFATAVSGPISSIAFLSGPIAGKLCGRNHSNIISSGLVGAILVLSGDFTGQYLLFTRYPVGVVTGILGAPYLIYLLISQNKKGKL